VEWRVGSFTQTISRKLWDRKGPGNEKEAVSEHLESWGSVLGEEARGTAGGQKPD